MDERKEARDRIREALDGKELPRMPLVVPVRFSLDVRDVLEVAAGAHFAKARLLRTLRSNARRELREGGLVSEAIERAVDNAVAAVELDKFFGVRVERASIEGQGDPAAQE